MICLSKLLGGNMNKTLISIVVSATALIAALAASAADKPLLGIVSITATEANNARYIKGAEKAASERGWDLSVIDAQGNADQANAGIQNFVQRKAKAIVDMVFPVSAIGAGLAAADGAKIPVATWGGGLGGSVIATNGSGGPMAIPIVEMMVKDLGGKGNVLALTYHTGEVCRNREIVMDEILAKHPDVKVSKNEVRIPGYFEDGAQYATAWLALHPAGSGPLAIWGCWDDPSIGAISALRQQGRSDVKVYGINGNAQALENIQKGFMTATAWQDSFTEGHNMLATIEDAAKAGAAWQPKAFEVTAVVVTKDTIAQFIKEHPDAMGQ
jgi:ribose transport system substrate-binding protein